MGLYVRKEWVPAGHYPFLLHYPLVMCLFTDAATELGPTHTRAWAPHASARKCFAFCSRQWAEWKGVLVIHFEWRWIIRFLPLILFAVGQKENDVVLMAISLLHSVGKRPTE